MINFVGAGPGATDLITVRGMELIKKADVIIYAGSLVNPALLNYAHEGTEIHDSSKMTLEEVLDVMIPAYESGNEVVRLHTRHSVLHHLLILNTPFPEFRRLLSSPGWKEEQRFPKKKK